MNLSKEELLSRKETLKQFENYIENTTNTLNSFVEKIGWKLDQTPVKDKLVQCPLNSEHRMLPSKFDTHYEICSLKQNGYDSTHSFYPSYNCSTSLTQTLKIDEVTQMEMLKSAYEEANFSLNIKLEPRKISQSIERYVCDFTPDERRVLYDGAIKFTKRPNDDNIKNDLTDVDIFNKTQNQKPKTELELLQEQRDLKRRRATYRGKRVHTDKKSYVEVLREVVEGLSNSLCSQEDKSACVTTSNISSEPVSNKRVVYKYEGSQKYNSNPYTRWLDIEIEESKLLKDHERKSDSLCQKASISRIQHFRDNSYSRESRRSSYKSRERRSSSESKYKKIRRSRTPTKFKETRYVKSRRSKTPLKYKEVQHRSSKIRSKSKENVSRSKRSRSWSTSVESKHKQSKRHEINLESKSSASRSQSILTKSKLEEPKTRRVTRSKSKECSSTNNSNHTISPINDKLTQSNEKEVSVNLKSGDKKKKKKKHKHKKKHSKSPKKLRK